MIESRNASKHTVLDKNGTHVGDIIRQHGSTLWSLQRCGMNRPFKRDIPSLDAAKALAENYPQVWAGHNFSLRRCALHAAVWIAIMAGILGALNVAIG
jgi:hypothetical protein